MKDEEKQKKKNVIKNLEYVNGGFLDTYKLSGMSAKN